jgi:hypothetical protein
MGSSLDCVSKNIYKIMCRFKYVRLASSSKDPQPKSTAKIPNGVTHEQFRSFLLLLVCVGPFGSRLNVEHMIPIMFPAAKNASEL